MCLFKSYDELPVIMSVQDVSNVLGISKNNAYYICRSKGFPAIRVGKQIRIPRDRFVDWLNAEIPVAAGF